MKYRKKQLIEVLYIDADGATVHNVGNEVDTWIIPLDVFNATYEPVEDMNNR